MFEDPFPLSFRLQNLGLYLGAGHPADGFIWYFGVLFRALLLYGAIWVHGCADEAVVLSGSRQTARDATDGAFG